MNQRVKHKILDTIVDRPPSLELDTLAVNEPQSGWTSYYITFGLRDYCGNYIYQNGNISMITTPAGYISGSMRYYYLKDYQGNNCVVLNQNGVVQQTIFKCRIFLLILHFLLKNNINQS